jgi:hypothetical protein
MKLIKKDEKTQNAFEIVVTGPNFETVKSWPEKRVSSKVKPKVENNPVVNQTVIDTKIDEKEIKRDLEINLKVLNGFVQSIFSIAVICLILIISLNN